MVRFWSPVLLVVFGSCQFGGPDREVEILPLAQEDETRIPSATDPVAELGPATASVEEALALRLAEQAARTQEARAEAERLRGLALQAEEAKARAEQDLLTAEAALKHERDQRAELEQEREFLLEQMREVQDQLLEVEDDSDQVVALQERLAALELELFEARVYQPNLENLDLADAMRAVEAALAARELGDGLEFFSTAGQPGLRLSGKILFLSGQVELDPGGASLLSELAADLLPLVEAGAQIQVLGHTDDEPVQKQAGRFPLGNLQLSCQRALVVAQALAEAGVPRKSLAVSGMGSFQPLLPNDSEENRARNRRVEILISRPVVTPVVGAPVVDALANDAELEPGLR
jgi:flagellar motor protein MotB